MLGAEDSELTAWEVDGKLRLDQRRTLALNGNTTSATSDSENQLR